MLQQSQQLVYQILQQSAWLIPALFLFIVAWVRFNQPPTNRSGTTFALFYFGVMLYYCLIIALWLLVIIAVAQGSIGLDWVSKFGGNANAAVQKQLSDYAPFIAALIIVVGAQFRQVLQIDIEARSFCLNAAAIPREADRLAIELAQSTKFQYEKLRNKVCYIISDNIGQQAFNFSTEGALPARFTRAVALYWLFVGARNDGKFEFPLNSHSKAAYSKIMQIADDVASRADTRYEDLMHRGLAYFTSQKPSPELKEALNTNIKELTQLVCSLIARFILYCEVTRAGRRNRLSEMGFDVDDLSPSFTPDQWALTTIAVMILGATMMVFMPGMMELDTSEVVIISITFGLSMGFAVLGAIFVAQRFIERHEGKSWHFPPVFELAIAALIVAGLSAVLRISIPLVLALIQGGAPEMANIVTQFVNRAPGIIIPVFCTISLGLLCSYLGSLSWKRYYIAGVGALVNGFALMAAGWITANLFKVSVLAHFFNDPSQATRIVAINTAVTGIFIGGMVLAVFNKSQHVRKQAAAYAAEHPEAVAKAVSGIEQLVF